MRTLTLAETKAHLSAVVDRVEAGEEIVITRRGRRVARIVRETEFPAATADALVDELRNFVLAQPERSLVAVDLVREMRDGARH